jgi:uncharacterized protein YecE (DUF72 family)
MRFIVGTSGFSYPAWKGRFYPEKLPQKEMLAYYAQRFAAVEINNSFYRMPSPEILKSWSEQVPRSFRFSFKAPQTITHFKRLKGAAEATRQFLDVTAVLGSRRGPLLFGLPPNFKKDIPRLAAFLASLGKGTRASFEFRHESWFDDEVFRCLRDNDCALCIADADDFTCPIVSTTRWGYVRLRRKRYTAKELGKWIERLRSQKWKEAYIFFKHEETGTGPRFAARFLELAGKQTK